jgi:hypothetical protein
VCSPSGKANGRSGSCLDSKSIDDIYTASPHTDDEAKTAEQKLNKLRSDKKEECDTDLCLIKTSSISRDKKKRALDLTAPTARKEMQKSDDEWLSDGDIADIIKQYENYYKNFEFIGPSPIDFDSPSTYRPGNCVCNNLCNFSVSRYLNTPITKIGIIFNLDKSTQSGSHWVSLFVDLENKQITFFDSTGEPAPPEVDALVKKTLDAALTDHNMKLDFLDIQKEHQRENNQCGMFSLFFIINMLKSPQSTINRLCSGKSQDRVTDKAMENLRHELFNYISNR